MEIPYQHGNIIKSTIPTLLALLLLITGCKKDVTDETDITEYAWELTSVETSGETITPDSVHILEFQNDTLFYLNLSVNGGGGYYNIPSPGNINIRNFGNFTEMCCDDTAADSVLLDAMPAVTAYRVQDDVLILTGDDVRVEFMKID
ncbi:MAG: META domain-containing protein [Bacteroidales bacterium]